MIICIFPFVHLTSAFCSLQSEDKYAQFCSTAIWPVLCTQSIHKGTYNSFCPFRNWQHSGKKVSRQPSSKELIPHLFIYKRAKDCSDASGLWLGNQLLKVSLTNWILRSKRHPLVRFSEGSGPHVSLIWGHTFHSIQFKASLIQPGGLEQAYSFAWPPYTPLQPSKELPSSTMGKSYLPHPWRVTTSDVSITCWGRSVPVSLSSGTWSLKEAKLSIDVL